MYKLFINGRLMPIFPDETVITRGDCTTIARLADGYDRAIFSPPAQMKSSFRLIFLRPTRNLLHGRVDLYVRVSFMTSLHRFPSGRSV